MSDEVRYRYRAAVDYGLQRHPGCLVEVTAFDTQAGRTWKVEVFHFPAGYDPKPPRCIAQYVLPRDE